jgi:TPP-dependent pyruvate/acetoin dehydrogenase alpha subunit
MPEAQSGAGLRPATRIEVQTEIEKAVQFAMSAPYPDASRVTEDVYA